MSRFTLLAALLCGMASAQFGSADGGCTLGAVTVSLPGYRADQDTSGTLDVQVTCAQPTQRYRLRLVGVAPTSQGDVVLHLGGGLQVQVLGAGPALSGQEYAGSQSLTFVLRAPSGQWSVAGGRYPARISVSLEPVGG